MDTTENAARAVVAGSERSEPPGARDLGPADPAERTTVTILVRARRPSAHAAAELARTAPEARVYLTREAFAAAHGADPADVLAVQRFATGAGLLVLEASLARRSVVVEGDAAALARAFGTTLRRYERDGAVFRARSGTLSTPAALAGVVAGVFGLDERPQARAQFRIDPTLARSSAGYTPLEVARAYAYPTGTDGAGQTIALVELGGGFVQADLDAYFAGLGIAGPQVSAVAVGTGSNAPTGSAGSADGEVMLDIEVAGAIAPGARIVAYFAPNTDQGFLDAITTAVHDAANRPTILSISWGGPESSWTAQAFAAFDAAFADAATLGMTVTAACGDSGSTDGVTDGLAHVDFPASSPHVLACGGTRLTLASGAIGAETVWNDLPGNGATGGGVSDAFPLPPWQASANVPPSVNPGGGIGRGVPDVSGDGDPQTGYRIRVDGADVVVGGTSAVAPLWAALAALLNARAPVPLGFVNPQLYANPALLRDVSSGSNGAYAAGPGWDACTGLGSPDGAALAAAFAASAPPAPPGSPAPAA